MGKVLRIVMSEEKMTSAATSTCTITTTMDELGCLSRLYSCRWDTDAGAMMVVVVAVVIYLHVCPKFV